MAKRNWQRCTRDPNGGRWAAIYATMNPEGVLHISRNTYEMLGEPEALHLLFDNLNNTIGLQPTRLAIKDAYPIKNKNSNHGKIIRGFAFAQQFGIRLTETVRFTGAEIDEDGILVLDLRNAVSAAKPKGATKDRAAFRTNRD